MIHLRVVLCALLLPAILGIYPAAGVTVSEQDKKSFQEFLSKADELRHDKYGNVHIVLTETDHLTTDGKRSTVKSEHEFWSRDDQYFRVDSKIAESDNPRKPVGMRHRLVLGPKGYVALTANSEKAPLTIHNWGTFLEGRDRLLANFFVYSGVRVGGISDLDTRMAQLGLTQETSNEKAPDNGAYNLDALEITEDNQSLRLESTWKGRTASTVSSVECDMQKGVVLHYEAENFTGNTRGSSTLEDKEYEPPRFDCISSSYTHVWKSYRNHQVDGTMTKRFDTRLVDWDAVPLEVFSLEAQGFTAPEPESVWYRRFWVVFFGLLIVGFIYFVRRAQTH